MEQIKKALHDIAEALESNEAVSAVKITITLKAKPNKAKESK